MTDLTLITFLGTANYKETTYKYKDEECKTNLFPVALSKFLRPSKVFVVITKEAKDKWLDLLRQGLEKLESQDIEMSYIDIPDGHSEEDLWNIFTAIASKIERGNRVVFDITHSFRTLPFLSFLAISYLRVAKQVEIAGIYYGAWEARKPQPPKDTPMQSCPEDISPVFNLTPFVTLLDWTSATDQFLKTGNAKELSDLLKERHDFLWKNKKENIGPSYLKNIGSVLERLSQALFMTRPRETSEHSDTLVNKIEKAKIEIEECAPPFAVLLEKVQEEYSKFCKSKTETISELDLELERELIVWYRDRKHVLQALTLAREWLVSWLGKELGIRDKDILSNSETRSDLEKTLNQAVFIKSKKKLEAPKSRYLDKTQKLKNYEHIHKLWSEIRELRNDAAHCGYRSGQKEAEKFFNNISKIVEALVKEFPVRS